MGKIVQLDDHLSNKIAAGEVVERPASVVKELVENAIDANSTIIEIEIEEAGLSKIRIIDNGDGIEEDDCLRAFQRHATSKIKDENDLFRIRTLGFRGEALPSIASVSELHMKTCTGEGAGTELIIKGGAVTEHRQANGRKGTDLTVSNLFYNTPARLKYIKTVNTELGNITDAVNRLAMAHPSVSFRLSHNGKRMLYTNGNGDVRQVMAAIYGVSIAKKLIPINARSLDFEISGFISLPEITRASRNYISTIINGRFIKNYSLVKAVQQGYHTLLPIGRYPIVFLKIDMDPILVDVNVHPAKLEVRLSKENELNELLESEIKAVLKKQQLIPSVAVPASKKVKDVSEQQQFSFNHDVRGNERSVPADKDPFFSPPNLIKEYTESVSILEKEVHLETDIFPEEEILITGEEKAEIGLSSENRSECDTTPKPLAPEPAAQENADRVPPMYPIGQMHGTYILAQNENGLYLIDQHAAQERIKYEYFREKVAQNESEVQEMLVPLTFTYSTDEYVRLEAHLEELAQVGVFLEPFGHNSCIVRSHPQWFPRGEEAEIIEEMIEQVLAKKRVDIKQLREEAAIMMSCKASIKANHHLRNDEIFALLESLRHSSDPFTCPHGRPIIVHFSTYEMEKMFKRVM